MVKLSKNNVLLFLSIIFSILSIIFLFIAIINIQNAYDLLDFYSIDFLVAGILCMVVSLFFSYRHRRLLGLKLLKQSQTVTRIKCGNIDCNYKEERFFQEGDYIFKEVGKCPKCNGNLYIDAIYDLELKTKK
ncbi:MAG: hypothetical protein HA488_01955 [Candidatus Verstraetearchaeota archaeon]|jgi:hypothetical protein|nr:hypothetical protein [Candidatus Culexarchaeum yellowstonense]NHV11954.1 hypothetical protein [Candidatus Verstraetearchaeota archaeon]